MPRHRKSRSQKGGYLEAIFGPSDPNKKSMMDSASGWFNSASSSLYSSASPAPAPTQVSSPSVTGGSRKRRHMRGGKGGLGLGYYASPVQGANVAEPTYWIKGGSRRRKSRKARRTRRHRRH